MDDILKPSEESEGLVERWLAQQGVSTEHIWLSTAGDWMALNMTIAALEILLHARYQNYIREDGYTLTRTLNWSLPLDLQGHIDVIAPTTSFVAPKLAARVSTKHLEIRDSSSNVPAECNGTLITPDCLRKFYGTYDYVPKAARENSIGLTDFLGNSNNRSDTRLFLEKYRPDAVDGADDFRFKQINGGSEAQVRNQSQLETYIDAEGNLDIQTIISVSYPTNAIAFTTGGSPPFQADDANPSNTNEPYLDWLMAVLALPQDELPLVISSSYADEEQTVPPSYARKVCSMFAQLGARGVSVLVASGDHGVGSNGTCFSNDGRNQPRFLPTFPASCPYVTTVGGTKGFSPEIVASQPGHSYASGGGFSNYFARPWYQNIDHATARYIDSLDDLYNGLFNTVGRGYPDLAAQSYHYSVIWNGTLIGVDGTSASTPLVASIFALANDALLAAGRPPLGFLNPWIYRYGARAFNDILNGTAIGCDVGGFPASGGWDAVTGYGTPMFPKIMQILFDDDD